MPDKERKDQTQEDERNEPYERFEDTLRKLAQVPKEEVDEERRKWEREQKRSGRTSPRSRAWQHCRVSQRLSGLRPTSTGV
jgi:hypothetical protein